MSVSGRNGATRSRPHQPRAARSGGMRHRRAAGRPVPGGADRAFLSRPTSPPRPHRVCRPGSLGSTDRPPGRSGPGQSSCSAGSPSAGWFCACWRRAASSNSRIPRSSASRPSGLIPASTAASCAWRSARSSARSRRASGVRCSEISRRSKRPGSRSSMPAATSRSQRRLAELSNMSSSGGEPTQVDPVVLLHHHHRP